MAEVLSYINEMKLVSRSDARVYGQLKREMWRETVAYLENWSEESNRDIAENLAAAREKAQREQRMRGWEKAKL